MPTMDPANSNPSRAEELKLLANEAFKGKPCKFPQGICELYGVAYFGFYSYFLVFFIIYFVCFCC